MTIELRFRPHEGGPFRADEARSLCAALLDGADDYGWVFHKTDGISNNGIPLVRWRGGKETFGLMVADPMRQAEAYQLAIELLQKLNKASKSDKPVGVETLNHQTDVTVAPHQIQYGLSKVVIGTKPNAIKRWLDIEPEALEAKVEEKIKELITRDFSRQAFFLAKDHEIEGLLKYAQYKFTLSDSGLIPLHIDPRGGKGSKKYGFAVSGELRTNLDISGSWAIGSGQNKGYGAIIRRHANDSAQ